jgi:hypothetical protein
MTRKLNIFVHFTFIKKVEVLREGQHSGESSGIVPSSFRILRKLLDRIEDADTGKLLVPELYTEIPAKRLEQAKRCAEALGQSVISEFPWGPLFVRVKDFSYFSPHYSFELNLDHHRQLRMWIY